MKTQATLTIQKVTVEQIPDEHTDLSYLGEFTDNPDKMVQRYRIIAHSNDRRHALYFVADNVENRKQAESNYNRIMRYVNGYVCDYGIKAVATVLVRAGNHEHTTTLESGGLWGVPSDDNEGIQETTESQLSELKDLLKAFGFTTRSINSALRKVEGAR